MTKNVLLLGVRSDLVREFGQEASMSGFRMFSGSGLDEVKSVMAETQINHVIIGGGIDLKTRLEIIQHIYHSSDRTTVHLKDQISGPEAFVTFARSVLSGLKDYEFVVSTNARSEIPKEHSP
jgi:hypothetical protein